MPLSSRFPCALPLLSKDRPSMAQHMEIPGLVSYIQSPNNSNITHGSILNDDWNSYSMSCSSRISVCPCDDDGDDADDGEISDDGGTFFHC